VVTTSVEVPVGAAAVRSRFAELADELTSDQAPTDDEFVLDGHGHDWIRLIRNWEPRGVLHLEFDGDGDHRGDGSEDGAEGSSIRARAEIDTAMAWWIRLLWSLPGSGIVIRRFIAALVQDMMDPDWEFREDPLSSPAPPPVLVHDPTRPASEDPEVAAILARNLRRFGLGAMALAATVAVGVAAIVQNTLQEDALVRDGQRVSGVVTAFDDVDWVVSVSTPDREFELGTVSDRVYRPGEEVVVIVDPEADLAMLDGEYLTGTVTEGVWIISGFLAAGMAAFGIVALARHLRVRRTVSSSPFEPVDVSMVPLMSGHRFLLRVFHSDGVRSDVLRTTLVFSLGAEADIAELPPRALVARAGRGVVLWRPGLTHLIEARRSRLAWRNRWRERRADRW
jgi:hypothetical protein